ncbi:hypothetical protein WAI453_006293 [Rhynchosporium graminicola]|uniref:Uncharacterized protein n=1 Tax=Rhynchosporium graminicola TaxID=2792576 RepID=A0A1E1L6Z1_9HELO|nr:uncharacterized protein RCO7_03292 [Rhynchosporium commune]
MNFLALRLGSLETFDQIVEAARSLQKSQMESALSEDTMKWHAVQDYLKGLTNYKYISAEVNLYLKIGQTTEFLLDGTKFDMDPKYSPSHLKNKRNIRALLELNSAVESWSYLSLEVALGHLMMHDHIQEVKAQNCSAAELFRAFIRVQGFRRGTSERCANYVDSSIKLLKAFAK